jgi:hypothetical protein
LARFALQVAAAAALLLVLWTLLRFALSLRYAKAAREAARRVEEDRGRRVVAEIPLADDRLVLFLEDDQAFYWAGRTVAKPTVQAVRLLLNGGVMASAVRPGHVLGEPQAPAEFEGRERWDVDLHLADGTVATVPCGTLREGVSREIATRVFERARAAVTAR